ncbi:hypothetical protein CEUSTIGMA_g5236.t1 [Chlamydomonas eustigma]|uniref:Uncharacterized protein n=1 Tax=Chlamydomonas eustigma TaxID=1157962 RepID=A0A250X3Y8_9CHLO|nr:hypothetical protein CEUSTIGMA_g5236.t1 [Chlamydomonas eustigma]|eukprot:GAX77793.1 hypothetical protein CEUSTIGMA_g5236.t1 [Chlamydomonas eustigma]
MADYDYTFKILLVGNSGVGKSCILMRFAQDKFLDSMTSTIGVDFRVKMMDVSGKRCKLSVWDTAGQERFRTLTSSYYRGAQGICFIYDVTRRESFEDLEAVWMREVELYSNVDGAVQILVANKVDLSSERQVTTEEGQDFAQRHGCLFVETSAKANVAVGQAFEELVMKILDSPVLIESSGSLAPSGVKLSSAATGGDQAGVCAC